MGQRPRAVVVGVGAEDGLGAALSRCYAANNHHILVAGRTLEKVEKVAATIRQGGSLAATYPASVGMDAGDGHSPVQREVLRLL